MDREELGHQDPEYKSPNPEDLEGVVRVASRRGDSNLKPARRPGAVLVLESGIHTAGALGLLVGLRPRLRRVLRGPSVPRFGSDSKCAILLPLPTSLDVPEGSLGAWIVLDF